jgi:hypothetical protein
MSGSSGTDTSLHVVWQPMQSQKWPILQLDEKIS